jgi:hypothetical protein
MALCGYFAVSFRRRFSAATFSTGRAQLDFPPPFLKMISKFSLINSRNFLKIHIWDAI